MRCGTGAPAHPRGSLHLQPGRPPTDLSAVGPAFPWRSIIIRPQMKRASPALDSPMPYFKTAFGLAVRHAPRQEAFELAGPHRVLELADGLRFHLPHALA